MDRFVYLVDGSELLDLRPDWPTGLSVALCLDAEGAAVLVLFETGEVDGLAERIAAAAGWASGSFAVSPEIEGCPTVRPLFSHAQDFTRMVARFEGLDRMVREFRGEEVPEPTPEPATRDPNAARQPAHRLNLSLPDAGAIFPDGYRCATEWSGDAAFLDAEVRVERGYVRLVIAPRQVRRRTRAVRSETVGFRDDLRCFVLRPDDLGESDPALGAIVEMPEGCFPPAFVSRLKERTMKADVTVTSEGVFVAPDLLSPSSKPPARRSSRGAVRATMVIGVAVGLLSGSVVTALQDATSEPSEILSYRAAPGHSALNVLESFARSMDHEEVSEY